MKKFMSILVSSALLSSVSFGYTQNTECNPAVWSDSALQQKALEDVKLQKEVVGATQVELKKMYDQSVAKKVKLTGDAGAVVLSGTLMTVFLKPSLYTQQVRVVGLVAAAVAIVGVFGGQFIEEKELAIINSKLQTEKDKLSLMEKALCGN